MQIVYKQVTSLNEFIDAIRIRVDVFIKEQHCPPGWEPDELDEISDQYIAIVNNTVVATARLREEPTGVGKIERMAVKKEYRRKGIAVGLTKYIIEQAKGKGYKKIWMQAQEQAKTVYEKAGFVLTSQPYAIWELGMHHVDMEYTFTE